MRLCVLASGSSGNCIYVESGGTALLVDAGVSARETERRLTAIGVDLAAVRGICLTHEHDDHRAGLCVLQRRTGAALYANAGTIEGVGQGEDAVGLNWNVFQTGTSFPVGPLTVTSFSVPHDSYDPVGYVIEDGAVRVGIVTDIGIPTGVVRQRLKACRVLVLEANHDEQLLKETQRPWALKQRILGRQGHLSNTQAGELLCDVASEALQTVFLAHLSSECNRPELALRTVRHLLERGGHGHIAVKLTYPDRPSEIAEV